MIHKYLKELGDLKEIDIQHVLSKIAFKSQFINEMKLIRDFEAFWVCPGRRDYNVLKRANQFVFLIDVYRKSILAFLVNKTYLKILRKIYYKSSFS